MKKPNAYIAAVKKTFVGEIASGLFIGNPVSTLHRRRTTIRLINES
jgi:hypothetical protein